MEREIEEFLERVTAYLEVEESSAVSIELSFSNNYVTLKSHEFQGFDGYEIKPSVESTAFIKEVSAGLRKLAVLYQSKGILLRNIDRDSNEFETKPCTSLEQKVADLQGIRRTQLWRVKFEESQHRVEVCFFSYPVEYDNVNILCATNYLHITATDNLLQRMLGSEYDAILDRVGFIGTISGDRYDVVARCVKRIFAKLDAHAKAIHHNYQKINESLSNVVEVKHNLRNKKQPAKPKFSMIDLTEPEESEEPEEEDEIESIASSYACDIAVSDICVNSTAPFFNEAEKDLALGWDDTETEPLPPVKTGDDLKYFNFWLENDKHLDDDPDELSLNPSEVSETTNEEASTSKASSSSSSSSSSSRSIRSSLSSSKQEISDSKPELAKGCDKTRRIKLLPTSKLFSKTELQNVEEKYSKIQKEGHPKIDFKNSYALEEKRNSKVSGGSNFAPCILPRPPIHKDRSPATISRSQQKILNLNLKAKSETPSPVLMRPDDQSNSSSRDNPVLNFLTNGSTAPDNSVIVPDDDDEVLIVEPTSSDTNNNSKRKLQPAESEVPGNAKSFRFFTSKNANFQRPISKFKD